MKKIKNNFNIYVLIPKELFFNKMYLASHVFGETTSDDNHILRNVGHLFNAKIHHPSKGQLK